MRKASVKVFCVAFFMLSLVEIFTGLSLSVYWLVAWVPLYVVQFIYEAYFQYYIFFAIITSFCGLVGLIGAFIVWRKFAR